MSGLLLVRGRSMSARLSIVGCGIVLAMLTAGCKSAAPVAAPHGSDPQTVKLPDGTILAIPVGATYFYSHAEVSGPISPAFLNVPANQNELVIARIDWSLCNPRAAAVRFTTSSNSVMGESTWRIPTLVTTPLAGINILGIFASGGTLEGGLRVDLPNGSFNDPGATGWQVADGCTGDWVSLYGYTR